MSDVRRTMEEISEMLRQQERELPLQTQAVVDPDASERELRQQWRRERAARRQERRQEPERYGDDWNAWCDQRIAIAIAAERAAYEQERKAFARQIENVVGEALAQLMHDLRSDLCDRLDGFANRVKELEGLWRASSNTSAAEIADLQRELTRLLKAHDALCRGLYMPTIGASSRPIAN
jgi:K+-sensing histidine kinase KdpD